MLPGWQALNDWKVFQLVHVTYEGILLQRPHHCPRTSTHLFAQVPLHPIQDAERMKPISCQWPLVWSSLWLAPGTDGLWFISAWLISLCKHQGCQRCMWCNWDSCHGYQIDFLESFGFELQELKWWLSRNGSYIEEFVNTWTETCMSECMHSDACQHACLCRVTCSNQLPVVVVCVFLMI